MTGRQPYRAQANRVSPPSGGWAGTDEIASLAPPRWGMLRESKLIRLYEGALRRRRLSPLTIRLRLFYLQKFEARHDLLSATLEDMEAFVDSKRSWSDNTRQTVVASLRSFYSWAHREGLVARNPAEELLRIKVRRRRGRVASDSTILRALETADPTHTAMLLLGAECGLRVSEIAGLHISSRDGEWLTIVGKGGQERCVHMREELIAALETIERTTMQRGYYFPGQAGNAMHPSTVWRHIRDAAGVNPHALRHRAATTVYRRTGNDLRTTQEFLGHASPNTTQVYVHIGRDDLMRASAAARLAAPISEDRRRLAA